MRRLALRISQPDASSDDLLFQELNSPQRLFRSAVPPSPVPHCSIPIHSEKDGATHSHLRSHTLPTRASLSKAFLRSKAYAVTGMSLAVLSFTLNDVRELALQAEADDLVDSVLFALSMLFAVDIGLKILARRKYRGSFAFWMDCIATVGLLADAHMVTEDFISECKSHYFQRLSLIPRAARLRGSAVQLLRFLTSSTAHSPASASFQPSPKKRTSVRPVSTVVDEEMVCSPTFNRQMAHSELRDRDLFSGAMKPSRTFTLAYELGDESLHQKCKSLHTPNSRESRISKKVTSRIVNLLVLVVIAVSLFSWVTVGWSGDEGEVSQMYGLKLLKDAETVQGYEEIIREFVNWHRGPGELETLVRLSKGALILWEHDYQSNRRSNICSVSFPPYRAEFSIQTKTQTFAVFDLCTTVLLCFLLLVTCLELSTVIRYMVLFPLEKMIHTVQQMAMNPLSFPKSTKAATVTFRRNRMCCGVTANYAEAEIKALEYAFRKIGVMLALVYGSAGSEIITSALSLQGSFSPVTPGRKVLAIFCFAKIAAFDVFLEVLGNDVLQYVNQASALIHSVSEKFLGSVNRNLGDSYLLVWKFPNRELITVKDRVVLNPFSTEVRTISSLALLFAVKAVVKVTASQKLFQYRKHKKVIESGEVLDNRVTFGFHVGWAFEGAIGSSFKIDASYLSPHVNLASRIESVTKQYGVTILMSGEMYVRLEEEVKRFNRLIDTVRLKGVAEPVSLYCFDLNLSEVSLKYSTLNTRKTMRKRARLKAALESGRITVSQMFTMSATIASLRKKHPKSFFTSYAQAYSFYAAGKWAQASHYLKAECLSVLPRDGPSRTLLAYMEDFSFEAPLTWRGYRELQSK